MTMASNRDTDILMASMQNSKEHVKAHVEVHEVCCGVGSMSYELQKSGLPIEAACDIDAEARLVFSERHHNTKMFDSLHEMKQWAQTRQQKRGTIVVGGPPCTALSEAGKQRFDKDASSDLLLQMVEYAGVVGADTVVLENVLELLDNPKAKTLLTQLLQLANAVGLRLIQVTRLKDSECGGGTQRRRGFLWFVSAWMFQRLRQWPGPKPPQKGGLIIEQALRDDSEVEASVSVLDAGTLRLKQPRPVVTSTSSPVVTGWMHIHPEVCLRDTVSLRYSGKVGTVVGIRDEGYEVALTEGRTTIVRIEQIASFTGKSPAQRLRGGQYIQLWDSAEMWKVMAVSPSIVQLRKSDRENPRSRRIDPALVQGWFVQKEPVYSRQSIGIGLRRFGEPVQQNSFLILCPTLGVRRLYGDEMWRLHGLESVQTAIPHYRLGEMAGNAVTQAMANVIARMMMAVIYRMLQVVRGKGTGGNAKHTPPERPSGKDDAGDRKDNHKRKASGRETPTKQAKKTLGGNSWVGINTDTQRTGTKRVLLLLVSSEERPRVAVKQGGELMLGQDIQADSRWHKEAKALATKLKTEELGAGKEW